MAKRPSLKSSVNALTASERAQEASRVAVTLSQSMTPLSPAAASGATPSRTTSYHLPDDLASLVEDLADARFRLMRRQREATTRAGAKWEGGRVRRSASGVLADVLEARREAMHAELSAIEDELTRSRTVA